MPTLGGHIADGQKCPRLLSWSCAISFAQTMHHYVLATGCILFEAIVLHQVQSRLADYRQLWFLQASHCLLECHHQTYHKMFSA